MHKIHAISGHHRREEEDEEEEEERIYVCSERGMLEIKEKAVMHANLKFQYNNQTIGEMTLQPVHIQALENG